MRQRQTTGRFSPLLRAALLLVALGALIAPTGATAGARAKGEAMVPTSLYDAALNDPEGTFDVIVQAAPTKARGLAAQAVDSAIADEPGNSRGVLRRFEELGSVDVELTGKQLIQLAKLPFILSITSNTPLALTTTPTSNQQWPYVTGAPKLWSATSAGSTAGPAPPTIAIVDSGIDATRADFGGRVVTNVNLFSGTTRNSAGDGRGHGTFVASIAAGQAKGYAGMAPSAPLVSLDVIDDAGIGSVSDLLAACNWLILNKTRYNIRVANFSILAASATTIRFDPLDRAVEKLWLSGLVVVTAAGNYGSTAGPSGVPFAPANDPFVITVGASDINATLATKDDFIAPWSAWGYTPDGFLKPDISAPGRYMVGAVPTAASFTTEHPELVVAPGYMQISGTSFAAPVVAGAAAQLLAIHSTWTPDQVKGALMLRANAMPAAVPKSAGVGEVNVAGSVAMTLPPNPNLSLRKFVVADPSGGLMFDAAAWMAVASVNPTWDAGTWDSGTWEPGTWEASALWTTASWITGTWEPGTWEPGTWEPSSFVSGTWEPGTWEPGTWEPSTWVTGIDPSNGEFNVDGGYWISDADLELASADLGLTAPTVP
jgi:serine protease AprX